MSAGALLRAARQQGQRRFSVLRQALTDGGHPLGLDSQHAAPGWPTSSLLGCGVPHSLNGSTFCSLAAISWRPHGASSNSWAQQQLRGFALGRRFRPRAKNEMPDRNLPPRNEQISAKEVGEVFLLCTLHFPFFYDNCIWPCRCECCFQRTRTELQRCCQPRTHSSEAFFVACAVAAGVGGTHRLV